MLRNEGDPLRRVVVCSPDREYTRVQDTRRQNFLEVPDAGLALMQHESFRRLLESEGVEVIRVTELRSHPNSVFVRDVALGTPGGFVTLSMGLEARIGEEAWISEALATLGVPAMGTIRAPGTLEGGDVFLMGDLALVGLSQRANAEGAGQLAALLAPLGYRMRTARIPPPHFHLGSVLSPVGPSRVVAVAGMLSDDFLRGLDVIPVPARGGEATANALCLRDGRVVADPEESPGTVEALEAAGVSVLTLDLSEFRKGSGGPTCLALPLERG
jgi:dimethylargininase